MTNSSGSAETEAPEAQQPRAIVAGHGSFATGLISAVQQISGRGDAFVAMSNQGLSGDDIETRLRAAATDHGVRVFFTDLPAGSATLAVRRIMRHEPDIVLVTGANLAALLEFVFHPDVPAADAARTAADKGRASMIVHGAG